MVLIKNIKKYQIFYYLMYCLLFPLIATVAEDYTGKTQRFGLLIFFLPIIIYSLWCLESARIKIIKMPISLVMFLTFLIIGFPFRNHNIREFLNMISFLVPYLGIFILLNNVKNKDTSYVLIKNTLFYFIAISFLMIFVSHLFTLLKLDFAPLHFIWETNGQDKPLKTLSYAGHHLTSFLGTYGILFSTHLFYTYIPKRKLLFYSLIVFFGIITILSSARIGLLGIFIIFPLGIICYKRSINPIIIPTLLLVMLFLFYISAVLPQLMFYMIDAASGLQQFTGLYLMRYDYDYLTLFTGREKLWQALIEMVKDNPIFGHGHPTPYAEYGLYNIRLEIDRRVGGSMFDAQSESGLLLAAKYGLPAFISYLFFLITPVLMIKNKKLKVLAAMVSSNALIYFMINGDFVRSFDHTIVIVFLFCLFHRYKQLEADFRYTNDNYRTKKTHHIS